MAKFAKENPKKARGPSPVKSGVGEARQGEVSAGTAVLEVNADSGREGTPRTEGIERIRLDAKADARREMNLSRPVEKVVVKSPIECRELKIGVYDVDSLPAAGAVHDGRILVEEGPGGRCLVYYAGGQRFRLAGTLF